MKMVANSAKGWCIAFRVKEWAPDIWGIFHEDYVVLSFSSLAKTREKIRELRAARDRARYKFVPARLI